MKSESEKFTLVGVITGILAYLIWGLGPVYWKQLTAIPEFEIIMHRIVWSFVFLMIFILLFSHWRSFVSMLRRPRMILALVVTSALVSTNWFVYIWAVNHEFILQASLGYYINPLVNVLLGMIFLKERLRRTQKIAVALAFIGVGYLTVFYELFPWIALTLAFTFGFYGLIRKIADVGSLVGLTIETLLLSFPALIYLIYLDRSAIGTFGSESLAVDLLLIGTALVTALPLLLFNIAAKRLTLTTVGFLQYIGPTCMFLLGVFVYGEKMVIAQVICFICIWSALAVYSLDNWKEYRKSQIKI